MPTTYARAANPIWTFFDQLGEFAYGAEMTTYRDVARQEKKPTYADPAGIIENPNPMVLNEIGIPGGTSDIYWANDEKYYVEIKAEDGTTYVFDNFPDAGAGGGSSVVGLDFENQLLDGQFRFFYDQTYSPLASGLIDIAPNWTFEKDNASATDSLSFERFNLGDNEPEASPIYYLHYVCTAQGAGETKKDIVQKMSDARTFEQQQVSFSFDAYTADTRTIEVYFVQNFGTGGSPSAEVSTSIGSFSVTGGGWSKKSATITVPSVGGKSLGTNEDDYVAIRIRMPLDSTSDIKFTNVLLNVSDTVLPYPRITKEKEDSWLLGNMIPTIGADDRGKAITANRRRKYDLVFPVPVGVPLPYFGDTSPDEDEWVLAQGQTVSTSESTNRYERLYNVIGHKGGHGFNSWLSTTNNDKVTVSCTSANSVTLPANGTSSPGFTYATVSAGSPAQNLFTANQINNSASIFVECLVKGAILGTITGNALAFVWTFYNGDAERKAFQRIDFKAASAMAAGNYFNIATSSVIHTFWYKIDGAGTAPATGFTLHEIDILSTDTATEVMLKTLNQMSGYQVDTITTVAASSIPAGSYFTIHTHTSSYYVWFKINGAGTDPKPATLTGIQIDLTASDTAEEVATKISTSIAAFFFQIPDLRGAALRGYDASQARDFDVRTFAGPGSIQYDQVLNHTHSLDTFQQGNLDTLVKPGTNELSRSAGGGVPYTSPNLDINHGGVQKAGAGGYETRMYNLATNFIIKL